MRDSGENEPDKYKIKATDFKVQLSKFIPHQKSKQLIAKYKDQVNFDLSFMCLSSGIGLRSLINHQPRGIYFISGTMQPMEAFEAEFQQPFPVQFKNNHVIDQSQVMIRTIPKDMQGNELLFTYKNRDKVKMQQEIGNMILEAQRLVTGGVLVFFSSFSALQKCKSIWSEQGLDKELQRHKSLYFETKNNDELKKIIHDFEIDTMKSDAPGSGSILVGVCRGKLSEGLDFQDRKARLVIVVGIPIPYMEDPKIV